MNFKLPPDRDKPSDPEPEPEIDVPPTFGDDLSVPELKQAIQEYAEWAVDHYEAFEEVDLSDVSIEISKKMKKAAGKAGAKKGLVKGELRGVRMRFAWKAYQKWGWSEDWTNVIRHELVHIWEYQVRGNGSHGPAFKRRAEKVDAPRHCPQFADYKYTFYCESCGKKVGGRYQRSKKVKNIDKYHSKCCNASVRVES